MEALSASDTFLFEGFRLDRRGLFRRHENAAATPIEIGSRALDVLRVLLERPGNLLSRNEIMATAWPGTVVENNNLNVQISTLRRLLDQHSAQGSCIRTVPGRGYRFVALVTRVDAHAHSVIQPISQRSERSRPRLSSSSSPLRTSATIGSSSISRTVSPKTSRPISQDSKICS